MQDLAKNEIVNWKAELKKTALRYHLIACWVGIVFNPIWAIADYYTNPAHWKIFFAIRIVVALATLVTYLFRKRLENNPELIALIPVLGISIQNAYMYSVMDVQGLQTHTFAYIALFIGAGMLVLWKPLYSIIVVIISIIANLFTFHLYSHLDTEQVLVNGGLLTASVAVFTIILINTRYTLTKKEIIARLTLAQSNAQLELQKAIIETKNKDITDSIRYAKRIQEAILPSFNHLKNYVKDAFVLYKPKDIVSGDFYWYCSKGDNILVAAADCTGHGVPGALMSMLGSSFLNEIVNEKKVLQPSLILQEVRSRIVNILNQNNNIANSKDGMDIAFINIDIKKRTLEYAGAFNPLWIVRDGSIIEIKADKFPIGNYVGENDKAFTNHIVELKEGDNIYMFSDGFPDQFGGPMGKKYKHKLLKENLLEFHQMDMMTQKDVLNKNIEEWRGSLEQVDDILIIGIKI